MRLITPRGQTIIHKVGELIDPSMGQWDERLIKDIFWPMDAQFILAIPLHDDFEDEWAWHYDSKGNFSVKSVYIMQCEQQKITNSRPKGEVWSCSSGGKGFGELGARRKYNTSCGGLHTTVCHMDGAFNGVVLMLTLFARCVGGSERMEHTLF